MNDFKVFVRGEKIVHVHQHCNNPLHAQVDGTPEPHDIGPSCMATFGDARTAISDIEKFITRYATLAHERYVLPLALWAAVTHIWPSFDTLPYLQISGYTKRCGKTRLMELMQKISSNGRGFSADSPASMFRSLTPDPDMPPDLAVMSRPTMFIDEAEKLNQEAHPAREFLNKGYKRGQSITRVEAKEVVDFDSFCPKCFVLIGDVYDTLRDRCIIVVMRRRSPVEAANETKYRRAVVDGEAEVLRGQLHEVMEGNRAAIEEVYANEPGLEFLNDRDEELWTPLFSAARVLIPHRIDELTRAAVDIATEKTLERRNFRELLAVEEQKADELENGILLLRDMLKLSEHHRYILSADAVEKLKAIPTSPWRTFRGVGLTMNDVSHLLEAQNVRPKHIRVINGNVPKAIQRGYYRKDLVAAAHLVGLIHL